MKPRPAPPIFIPSFMTMVPNERMFRFNNLYFFFHILFFFSLVYIWLNTNKKEKKLTREPRKINFIFYQKLKKLSDSPHVGGPPTMVPNTHFVSLLIMVPNEGRFALFLFFFFLFVSLFFYFR